MSDARPPLRGKNLKMHKVAVLQTRGMQQQVIMTRLDVSQSTVSRLTQEAVDAGLIERQRFVWRGDPDMLVRVQSMLTSAEKLEADLRAMCGAARRLLEVEIVDDVHSTSDAISDEFANRVARYLHEGRLPENGFVGVAWGGTLLGISKAMERQIRSPRLEDRGISFVPICGDPPEVDRDPERAAASIAARFESVLTGKTDFAHSFSSVSACIPFGFDADRAETIRAFFRTNPGYAKVFGKRPNQKETLVARLDGCLTSLRGNEPGESWLESASAAAGFDSARLAAASTGNIGGLFLAKPDASKKDRDLVAAVNQRWTGIRLKHLDLCAREAAKDPRRLGVVVIAGRSASQISTAIECVRLGLANRLVLDPRTAEAIGRAL